MNHLASMGFAAAHPEDVLLQGPNPWRQDRASCCWVSFAGADGVGELGIHLAVELIQQADAGVDAAWRAGSVFSLTVPPLLAMRLSRYWFFWNSWSRCWLIRALDQVQVGDLLSVSPGY